MCKVLQRERERESPQVKAMPVWAGLSCRLFIIASAHNLWPESATVLHSTPLRSTFLQRSLLWSSTNVDEVCQHTSKERICTKESSLTPSLPIARPQILLRDRPEPIAFSAAMLPNKSSQTGWQQPCQHEWSALCSRPKVHQRIVCLLRSI